MRDQAKQFTFLKLDRYYQGLCFPKENATTKYSNAFQQKQDKTNK